MKLRAGDLSMDPTKKKAVKGRSYLSLLWSALGDFTLRILLAASAFSIILDVSTETDQRNIAWIEGFAIFMAVMISSNVQAFNDFQKEKQFRKLNDVAESRKTLSVIRDDGKVYDLHQSELIPGDIVSINEGTDIPADGFVIEAHGLTADESAMTGETDPIKKHNLAECKKLMSEVEAEGRRNSASSHEVPSPILLAGTKVASGTGRYVVIIVGKDSSIGKIRDLLEQDSDATPLQQKLEKDSWRYRQIWPYFCYSCPGCAIYFDSWQIEELIMIGVTARNGLSFSTISLLL